MAADIKPIPPTIKGVGSLGKTLVEDFAAALIRMDNGAVISLEAGWAGYTAAIHAINLKGPRSGSSIRRCVHCEH